MSRSTSPNHGLLASPSSNSDNGYDEERLQYGGVVPRWSKFSRQGFRVPRLRRMGLCLLLIDLFIVGILVHMFNPLITLLRRNEELFGARLTLPLDTPYADGSADKNAIPRILHQTSATEVVPEKWVESVNGCKEVYSKFEYKHWTDELARQFIEKEYNWFLDIWDGYPYPIQRADAIRYFVLHYYGGLYLDMDTTCNNTIPLNQIEADGGKHHAVFKSTTPTGVSNDLMIASAHHPVFTLALSRLRFYNDITRFWSGLLPHAAIMIAAGPLFITMAAKNYLLELPSLPDKAFSVINATELAPYITDLEGSSWHHGDTKTLMYVGDRPWIWFGLGAIGLTIGLHIINNLLSRALRRFDKAPSGNDEYKMAKLT